MNGDLLGHLGHDPRWHRNLVADRRRPGRPSTGVAITTLIRRIARDNPTGGYRRIQGELTRLENLIAASTVWEVVYSAGINPAPWRTGSSWRQFLAYQAHAIIACDFLVVETVLLKRLVPCQNSCKVLDLGVYSGRSCPPGSYI